MPLIRPRNTRDLIAPTVVVALDAWVDAGAASTTAAKALADDAAPTVAAFESDVLFDYRSRRPTLEIMDGRPASLTWPDLSFRRTRIADRDILVLTGAEPDFRWRELADDLASLARQLEVEQWISLGAIPLPHAVRSFFIHFVSKRTSGLNTAGFRRRFARWTTEVVLL